MSAGLPVICHSILNGTICLDMRANTLEDKYISFLDAMINTNRVIKENKTHPTIFFGISYLYVVSSVISLSFLNVTICLAMCVNTIEDINYELV